MPGHPRSARPYFQVVLALSAAHRTPAMGQPSLERETSRRGPNASRILKTRFARIFLAQVGNDDDARPPRAPDS